MRLLLGAALLAVAAIVALLLSGTGQDRAVRDSGRAAGTPAEDPGRAGSAGADSETGAALPDPPADRTGIDAFLAASAEAGVRVVPHLLELLEEGTDTPFEPRWEFTQHGVHGFPTLRSVYLHALAATPGEEAAAALRAVLAGNASPEEAYMIALSLEQRGEDGWADAALDKAALTGTVPAKRRIGEEIAALAARSAPAETMAKLVAAAPRGEQAGDARVFARALTALPLNVALATAEQLLNDPRVTPPAKWSYLEAYCARPQAEPEAFRGLRTMMREGNWSPELRLRAAYLAAGAPAFAQDRVLYEAARAAGDRDLMEEILVRSRLRSQAVTEFVEDALGESLANSADPRAAALRRALERHAIDVR